MVIISRKLQNWLKLLDPYTTYFENVFLNILAFVSNIKVLLIPRCTHPVLKEQSVSFCEKRFLKARLYCIPNELNRCMMALIVFDSV